MNNQYFRIPDSVRGRGTPDKTDKGIKWAYGEAGLSFHLYKGDSGVELLLGAPGIFIWAGIFDEINIC